MKIKVCGLRDPANIAQVCRLQPDFVGYIFYPRSKRYVGARPDPAIFRIPEEPVKKVGVFVNEKSSFVRRTFEKYNLDMVQLHGEESPEYCRELSGSGIPVIRSLVAQMLTIPERSGDYLDTAVCFLIDRQGRGYGGSGKKFDWSLLRGYALPFPFILSGGIGPGDAGRVRKADHEQLFGVDLNSRFESSPGIKEVDLLQHFISAIRTSES